MKILILVAINLAILLILVFGAWRVIRDTIRGNGIWGISFRNTLCPDCGSRIRAGIPRLPETWKQALWGGWNCRQCGCQIDKWGNPLNP